MNIFVLDNDLLVCAQSLCDKHVPKMVLETAQLLSTAAHQLNFLAEEELYKPTHKNHPCSKWLLESPGNRAWLWHYGQALSDEYAFRFGKTHKSRTIINRLFLFSLSSEPATSHPLCMPDQYKQSSVVESYRAYYRGDKKYFAKWERGRPPPSWWSN